MRSWCVVAIVAAACGSSASTPLDDTAIVDTLPTASPTTDTGTPTPTADTAPTGASAPATGDTAPVGTRLVARPPVICLAPEERDDDGPFVPVNVDTPEPPTRSLQGGGAAAGDLDGDGDLDLVGAMFDRVIVWLQDRPQRFVRVERDPIEGTGPDAGLVGVSLADADGDGDLDALVTGRGVPSQLLINDGTAGFTDALDDRGLGVLATGHHVGAAWHDVDGDGDLDLFVAGHGPYDPQAALDAQPASSPSRLFLQEAGTFTEAPTGLPADLAAPHTLGGVFLDVDGDRSDELFVVQDLGLTTAPSRLLAWNGTAFAPATSAWGLVHRSTGAAAGDLDGDGVEDLVVAGADPLVRRTARDAGWVDLEDGQLPRREFQTWAWGPQTGDLDNDGRLDIAVSWATNGTGLAPGTPLLQPDAVYLQQPDGSLADQAEAWGVDDGATSRAPLLVDLDHDGWLDIVKMGLGGISRILFARCGDPSWSIVTLRQEGPNPFAVGATVRLTTPDGTQVRRVRAGGLALAHGGPPEVHVGQGPHRTIDRLEVIWPDGVADTFTGVLARRHLTVDRRGSP